MEIQPPKDNICYISIYLGICSVLCIFHHGCGPCISNGILIKCQGQLGNGYDGQSYEYGENWMKALSIIM